MSIHAEKLPSEIKPRAVHMALLQGSAQCAKWFTEFAEHVGVSKASVLDLALKDYAAKTGFRPMPRRRMR